MNITRTPLFATLLRSTAALCAGLGLLAQTVTYSGVGGRHEQSRYFIQRNVPLATTGSVNVPASGSNRRIFVRFLTGSSSDEVSGFDINMKFGILGEVVPAWIYTADAQDRPGSPVLTGSIGIGINMHQCRASFPTTYTVQPNRLYFMAFQLPAGENVVFGTASGSATNVTWFVTPNGPAQQASLQYGVHRGGFSPSISLQQPRIGQTYNVGLTGASLHQPAVVWFQLINPGAPQQLYPFGASGSFLYLDLHNMLLGAVVPGAPNRQRNVTFLMPHAPNLVGLPLHFQWQVGTDDTGIPAGWVTSNLASCTIL
ncbi:MAG: hypothetical protein MUC36_28465 [Planctomycetes bacterium]|jgi:hypothetical protein|nr:hypothetical protein [Planctomycetota bacterium]